MLKALRWRQGARGCTLKARWCAALAARHRLKAGRQGLDCCKAQVEVGALAARRTWMSAHMD
jgi:hypothetical protein